VETERKVGRRELIGTRNNSKGWSEEVGDGGEVGLLEVLEARKETVEVLGQVK
jgi:hypothetical protein